MRCSRAERGGFTVAAALRESESAASAMLHSYMNSMLYCARRAGRPRRSLLATSHYVPARVLSVWTRDNTQYGVVCVMRRESKGQLPLSESV